MFARGVFSFHSLPLPASVENSPSPIVPTLARRFRKSNHSRTSAIPGGGGYTGFLVRPIRLTSKSFVSPTYAITGGCTFCGNVGAPTFPCSFSSQALPRFSFFLTAYALFHFPYHPYLPVLQHLPHSSPKNPGIPPPAGGAA